MPAIMGDHLLMVGGRGSIILGLSGLHRFVFMRSAGPFERGGGATVFQKGVHRDEIHAGFLRVFFGRPLFSYKMINGGRNYPRR